MLTKKDFKVGQQVACKYAGNMARRSKGYRLGTVSKVENKLITVVFAEGTKGVQFKIEEDREYFLQKTNYSGDFDLFPSEQAYLDYEEKMDKLGKIHSATNNTWRKSNLTIDQVRRIYAIIEE